MKGVLEYKGYHTKIEFDSEEFILRGKIEGINDLVNFESEDIKGIEKEFHEAVDEYLEFCKEVGKEPDKEYKGTFNVRVSPDLHKKLVIVAMKNGDSLNASVEKAISEYVLGEHTTERHLQNTIKILTEALKTESVYRYEEKPVKYVENTIPFFDVNMTYNEEMTN